MEHRDRGALLFAASATNPVVLSIIFACTTNSIPRGTIAITTHCLNIQIVGGHFT